MFSSMIWGKIDIPLIREIKVIAHSFHHNLLWMVTQTYID